MPFTEESLARLKKLGDEASATFRRIAESGPSSTWPRSEYDRMSPEEEIRRRQVGMAHIAARLQRRPSGGR